VNYPDGGFASTMSETEGYHDGCPSEDGRVFYCPDGSSTGHYFVADFPVKRGANFCKTHNWPSRKVWSCMCDVIE